MSLQLSDLNLKEDPSRPVQSRLSHLCLENLNAGLSAFSSVGALPRDPLTTPSAEVERVRQLANDAIQHLKIACELVDWVYPAARPLSFAEALGKARELTESGADTDWVKAFFSGLQKRPVGRPHQRQLFVRAFEFQLQSKKNSQGQATRRFCPCGNKHTTKCEQNLKAGIRSLKRVLRRYAPELVTRYEALHPDRAKRVNG